MIYKITELVKSVPFSTKQVRHVLTVPFSEQGPKYVPKSSHQRISSIMEKVYIAAPLNDGNKIDIYSTFYSIVEDLQKEYDVLNTVPNIPDGTLLWLASQVELLQEADVVYMVYGWETRMECRLLEEIAAEYEIPIVYDQCS